MKNTEREYKKARDALRKKIAYWKKLGVENLPVLPPIPKKITAGSVRRVKAISEKVLAKAVYVDTETGEIIEGDKWIRAHFREKRVEKRKRNKQFQTTPQKTTPTPQTPTTLDQEDMAEMVIRNFLNIFSDFDTYATVVLKVEQWKKDFGVIGTANNIVKSYNENPFESLSSQLQNAIAYSAVEMLKYLDQLEELFDKETLNEIIAGNEDNSDYDTIL